jgi:hypothetical protein
MLQICCKLQHIFFAWMSSCMRGCTEVATCDTFFCELIRAWKRKEEADRREGVWVTHTDDSAECIGEALPFMMNAVFF